MNKPLYIVLAGRKQHGKDTVAVMLEKLIYKDRLAKDILITSFAAPLKRFCHEVFGFSWEDMATEEGKQKQSNIKWEDIQSPPMIQDGYMGRSGFMTIREVLQYFGSNICRNRFLDRIWAQGPFSQKTDADVVIVTDCRFRNELAEARKNNAIVFRVWREPSPTGADEHISEKDLDGVVWPIYETILNWGSLVQLEKSVEYVYNQYVRPHLVKPTA